MRQLSWCCFAAMGFFLVGMVKGAESQCWFLPPGGVFRYGLNQVSVTPNYAEASSAEAVAWLDDGRVAVGYTGYTSGHSKNGLIRMYHPVTTKLTHQSVIRPPAEAYSLSRFGRVIGTSGNWLASTYVVTNIAGRVAIYESTSESEWTLRGTLQADNPANDDQFGAAIAMNGEWMAVADLGSRGGVYIFKRGTGGEWTKSGIVGVPGYQEGTLPVTKVELAMRPGLLAVGQPTGTTDYPGRVHFYRLINDAWQYESSVSAPDGAAGDRFGNAVSLTSNRLVVGATHHDADGVDHGAVYVFKETAGVWTFESKILNPKSSTYFGSTVSLSPDGSLLGAGGNGGYTVFTPSGTDWVAAGANGGGNVFYQWESPAGTFKDYLYGTTNATPEFATQRGKQAMVKFRFAASLLELDLHAVTTRRMTNSQTTCIWIPTGFAGNGPGPVGSGDQDKDGRSDMAEAYHGTYFDTYNTLSSGLVATRKAGEALSVEWPHLTTESGVSAAPEWSTDLSTWRGDGIQVQKVGEEPETGREILRATVPDQPEGRTFLRLRFYPSASGGGQ